MKLEEIFVDFNNVDKHRKVRLTSYGSEDDIKAKGIILREGLEVTLHNNDGLSLIGIIEYSDEEKIWVAKINWESWGELPR